MARNASSKPDSGSSSTATLGFEADPCPLSIRHSEFVISFAWVKRCIHHLAPQGTAGFVLVNGSMSSNQTGDCPARSPMKTSKAKLQRLPRQGDVRCALRN